jgi:hypothetical protein
VREQIKRSDPETEALAAVLAALDGQFPKGQEFSTAQIIEAVRRSAQTTAYGDSPSPLQAALEDALPRGGVHARSLGMWFHWRKGRLVNGLRLLKIGTTDNTALWRIGKAAKDGERGQATQATQAEMPI